MRIEDALDRYLLQLQADGRSEHTVDQYRRHLRLLTHWAASEGLSGELGDIDHEVLARFMVSPEARMRPDGALKKATSVNALRSTLRTFLRFAHEVGWVRENPARVLRRARCGPPPPRGLSELDQRALLATLAAAEEPEARRDHALFSLMLATGLRVGSAVALDVEDLDLDAGEVAVRRSKGDREERVFLRQGVCELLRGFVGNRARGPLFTTKHGRRLTVRQVRRRLGEWMEKVGVRHVGPHGLRHSFALSLYARTGDVLLVQRALGHRSLSSTLIYARASDERLRAAVWA